MNSPWPLVPLSEVLSPISRPERVDPEKSYNILGAHWYAEGLYIKDVLNGSEIRADQLYRVERGDFVYNRLFGWKGSFALATDENDGCYVSNEFPCFLVRSNRAVGKYLWRYFSLPSVWDEVFSLSTGGTPTSRNRLKEAQLLGMRIPLPPLVEQRRIIARIEELSAKIEEARKLRSQAVKESAALLQASRYKSIGEVHKSWVPLSTYIQEIENGWSPACENRPTEGAEWGVLKVGAVSFGAFEWKQNKALPASLIPDSQFEVHAGDFLMSRANTTALAGACVLVKETPPRLMLSDKIFRFIFRADASINRRYLWHVLISPTLRTQIERGATGTSPTMKNISKEKVLKLFVPMHSAQEQDRIVAYLDDIQARVDSLKNLQEETAKELNALMPSILSRAFSGAL